MSVLPVRWRSEEGAGGWHQADVGRLESGWEHKASELTQRAWAR